MQRKICERVRCAGKPWRSTTCSQIQSTRLCSARRDEQIYSFFLTACRSPMWTDQQVEIVMHRPLEMARKKSWDSSLILASISTLVAIYGMGTLDPATALSSLWKRSLCLGRTITSDSFGTLPVFVGRIDHPQRMDAYHRPAYKARLRRTTYHIVDHNYRRYFYLHPWSDPGAWISRNLNVRALSQCRNPSRGRNQWLRGRFYPAHTYPSSAGCRLDKAGNDSLDAPHIPALPWQIGLSFETSVSCWSRIPCIGIEMCLRSTCKWATLYVSCSDSSGERQCVRNVDSIAFWHVRFSFIWIGNEGLDCQQLSWTLLSCLIY